MLEIRGSESGGQDSAMGNGDVARLFRHHNRKGIRGLRDAECGAMTQTERAGDVAVMTHGKDASAGIDAVMVDDHRAVVERGVLEKDILDESRVDVGVYYVAAAFV